MDRWPLPLADAAADQRCRAVAWSIGLPRAFSQARLVSSVADQLGCRIRLAPLPWPPAPAISGACSASCDGIVVHYPSRAPGWFQVVVIAHELSHVLLGHLAVPDGRPGSRVVDALVPDLQAAQSRWCLYRAATGGPAEQEAELVASHMVARIEEQAVGSEPALLSMSDVEVLRERWWSPLTAAVGDLSPWPDLIRRPANSQRRRAVQQQRLITEIYDGLRLVDAHVPVELRARTVVRVRRAGLVGDVARAAAEQVGMALGLAAAGSRRHPGLGYREPRMPGSTTAAAARYAAARPQLTQAAAVQAVIAAITADVAAEARLPLGA